MKHIVIISIVFLLYSCSWFEKKEPATLPPAVTLIDHYADFQKQVIDFDQYSFSVSVLTTAGPVDPFSFELRKDSNLVKALALDCICANTRQSYTGKIEFNVGRNVNGSISWQVFAEMSDPVKGIKVEIHSIPGTRITMFPDWTADLPEGEYVQFAFPSGYYPYQIIPQSESKAYHLNAQAFILHNKNESKNFLLRSEDSPTRFHRYWICRKQDSLRLITYTEANACERKTEFATAEWLIEKVPDIMTGFRKHMDWMEQAYGLTNLDSRQDAPDWIHNLYLNIAFQCRGSHGRVCHSFDQISERLQQIAEYIDPNKSMLLLAGWDGPWDWTYPFYRPDPSLGGEDGFKRMMKTAHELGYKVGVHMNVWGLGKKNPAFEEIKHFLDHQCRDAEGRPLQWEYDMDGDDQDDIIFYYISPDHEPWRQYMMDRILMAVNDFDLDIVHLDQSSLLINDCCHNHYPGVVKLFQELRENLPVEVVLSGEGTSEPLVFLYPMCEQTPQGRFNLFNYFVKSFDYGYYPEKGEGRLTYDAFDQFEWDSASFYNHLNQCINSGIIPTLRLGDYSMRIDSKEAIAVYEAAKNYPPSGR